MATTRTPKTHLLKIISTDGSMTDGELNPKLFGARINKAVLAQYIRVIQHNTRQGTASTKDRSQIIGTTKKMYKQKGTGNARHASAKAPIFVGGGVAGGPKPRDYSLKITKSQKSAAFRSALSSIAAQGVVARLDATATSLSKTKDFMSLLAKAKIATRRMVLVVDPAVDALLSRASRNVSDVSLVSITELNAYDIAKASSLVFSDAAYVQFLSRFS